MSLTESKPDTQQSVPFDTPALRDIVSFMLEEAGRGGASGAEAGLSVESGLQVTVRLGEVETIEHNRDKGLGITVYMGSRKGSASTTDFTRAAIRETVQAACDIARYTEEDPYAGLPEPNRLAKTIPDLDLDHPWALSPEQAIDLATRCEDAARQFDPRITNSEGAYITSHRGLRIFGNSLGFLQDYCTTRHSSGCTVIASSGDRMERDYWYSISRLADQLEDINQIGEHAARRAVRRLDARRMKTRKLPVMFQAEVARGLLGHLVRAISGGALYRNASFMLDKLDTQIMPEFIQIDEQPHIRQAIGSAPFDSEGVATQARTVVGTGTLNAYVLDSYAARRLNMESTGNAGGVHNLIMTDTAHRLDQQAMIRELGTGLLITEVMGQGVNIVTGDYSRGAAGFWIENGELQYPVEEFTIAGNLSDMFRQIVAVGCDVDARSSLITGSWLIEEMTIAGE